MRSAPLPPCGRSHPPSVQYDDGGGDGGGDDGGGDDDDDDDGAIVPIAMF